MTVYRAFTRPSEDIPLVWDILEKQKIPTTFVEGIFLFCLIVSEIHLRNILALLLGDETHGIFAINFLACYKVFVLAAPAVGDANAEFVPSLRGFI